MKNEQTTQAAQKPPGIDALACVIASLRDTAHFQDEEGELTNDLRALRDWAMLAASPQPPAVAQEPITTQSDHDFTDWYETKFRPAMERGPFDKYVARQAWYAALRTSTTTQQAPAGQGDVQWMPASEPPPESEGEVLVRMADGRCEIAWATYWHGSSDEFAQWTFRDPDEDEQPVAWMRIPAAQAKEQS